MSGDTRHLPDECLLQFVDGELEAGDAVSAREHLRACAACRSRASRFEASAAAFGRAYRDDARPTVSTPADRSRDALKAQLREADRRGPAWMTACALLVAALAGLEFLSSRSGPSVAPER